MYIGKGAHDNIVDKNIISGNDFEGVCIVGYAELGILTYANTITSNFIGFTVDMSALPNESNINLRIYDISGKIVRTIFEGVHDAGVYTVSWNGTDTRGRKVPQGIYFYRIEAAGWSKTGRMVFIR